MAPIRRPRLGGEGRKAVKHKETVYANRFKLVAIEHLHKPKEAQAALTRVFPRYHRMRARRRGSYFMCGETSTTPTRAM